MQEHTFAIRTPTEADAPAIVELINACSIALGGSPDFTLAGLREDWDDAGFALATDALRSGRMTSYWAMSRSF